MTVLLSAAANNESCFSCLLVERRFRLWCYARTSISTCVISTYTAAYLEKHQTKPRVRFSLLTEGCCVINRSDSNGSLGNQSCKTTLQILCFIICVLCSWSTYLMILIVGKHTSLHNWQRAASDKVDICVISYESE